jgi:hypothetical protein
MSYNSRTCYHCGEIGDSSTNMGCLPDLTPAIYAWTGPIMNKLRIIRDNAHRQLIEDLPGDEYNLELEMDTAVDSANHSICVRVSVHGLPWTDDAGLARTNVTVPPVTIYVEQEVWKVRDICTQVLAKTRQILENPT